MRTESCFDAPERRWDEDDEDIYLDDDEYLPVIIDSVDADARANWLSRIHEPESDIWRSARTQNFLELYDWLRATYPDESMIVFSQYLKLLDLVAVGLQQTRGVDELRFDGTLNYKAREAVRAEFLRASPAVPMLITGSSGGTGLELQKVYIVIQTEVWWNGSAEAQAYCKVLRPGQKFAVKIFRLMAYNSEIDSHIAKTQDGKTKNIDYLTGKLIRRHDVAPEIPELAPVLRYSGKVYSPSGARFPFTDMEMEE